MVFKSSEYLYLNGSYYGEMEIEQLNLAEFECKLLF